MDSIKEVGLLNPIAVTEDMRLIAGLHRLEACKSLGWPKIDVRILSLSAIDAEMAEIDENLVRNELTVLERAEHLARRKKLYDAKHPQTKKGGAPGKGGGGKRKAEGPETFSRDASRKLRISPRVIQEEIQIAKGIDPSVKEKVKVTPVANSKSDLAILSQASTTEQHLLIDKVVAGKAQSIAHAKRRATKKHERRAKATVVKLSDTETLKAILAGLRQAQNQWETLAMRWKVIHKVERIELAQRSPEIVAAFETVRSKLASALAACEGEPGQFHGEYEKKRSDGEGASAWNESLNGEERGSRVLRLGGEVAEGQPHAPRDRGEAVRARVWHLRRLQGEGREHLGPSLRERRREHARGGDPRANGLRFAAAARRRLRGTCREPSRRCADLPWRFGRTAPPAHRWKNTIFGVSSWVQHNNLGYSFCDHVNVFATFGPTTQAFITKALTWQDACEALPVKGRCDGDVAIRCAAKSEGARRVLRTDCAELGLTCGAGADGQVACVDPA